MFTLSCSFKCQLTTEQWYNELPERQTQVIIGQSLLSVLQRYSMSVMLNGPAKNWILKPLWEIDISQSFGIWSLIHSVDVLWSFIFLCLLYRRQWHWPQSSLSTPGFVCSWIKLEKDSAPPWFESQRQKWLFEISHLRFHNLFVSQLRPARSLLSARQIKPSFTIN